LTIFSSAFYGNPDLRPERSRSWDIGIEHGSRRRGPYLAISAFRRDSTDLINYTCCTAERPFGTYENVGEARAEGIELEAGGDIGRELRLQGVYSHVASVDRTAGEPNEGRELARRPRHSATISADWNRSSGVKLGADLRIVGGSFDDAANLVPLDGYAVLTLRGSVAVSQRIELFGRVENVWDEQYQTVAGYGTQGRAGWIGARARW
jgi:vitamin B12 transporter